MLWLYINFPSLQLDCLQAEQCSAKSAEVKKHNVKNQQAIVIVDSKKNRIVQLNETAKAKGIELAMGLAMAASLSHELCVVPYQREEQETYLLSIAEQLYSVTANIALFPPQGLALQVGNMLRLYQQLDIYIAAIKAVLKPFNVQTVIACGYSPIPAQALACAGINLLTTKASVITEKMTQLTIAQLFINDKTKHVLARLGINTFAQLQAIPIKDLAKRLDSETIGYLAQLTGKQADKSLVFYQPKHIFDHSVELLYEMTHVDVLLQPIQQLLQLLEAFLIRRDYICQQLTLYLYQRLDGLSHVLQQSFIVSSASGEYLAKQWLNLVTLKLTNIHLQAPITKVSLFVADMQANTGEVDDLFLGKRGQLSLAQLASLLTNKLGQNKVLRLQQGNDHRVELASAYHPFIEAKALPVRHEKDKNSKNLQTSGERGTANINHAFTKETDKPMPLRPSFILDKPELLQTHVSILHGPERITTAWWEQTTTLNTRVVTSYHQETVDQAYQRDYFVATTKQGQCCWVYKALDKRWYVHGYFS